MTIVLNGAPRETGARTLAELLVELEFSPVGLAVAVNEQVVRRASHAQHVLRENDTVEIIRAVQGG